ncbi:patatin-like phospholipase family protein [Candidatus Nitronereus thalassa]|uniref:Patatin-like phospholipase family protein n=1 Tax=Candidatus Nitronereus thalassa TaxID=3020898 RepID=A0ABU3K4T3_9BACT|nr:patatin-like phospholipase family protein [Candidatus Nitronereus thalassa]MDT7041379.1 patatin-like phospholipase family protein [Candidatus Nitronereus thalassa]
MVNRWIVLVALCFASSGCATFPENTPLSKYDPQAGYRFGNLSAPSNSDKLFVILTFSGGGTRAAALSYGVLETLRDTTIAVDGETRRLLDEVDVISSVSGGSFTSAYYALFREKIFVDFTETMLYRDIEGDLLSGLLNPGNWGKLLSPTYSRSDMAAEYYDEHIFQGKTFAALVADGRRPFILLNATDVSLGASFRFSQDGFDWLCSDLSSLPVARAVTSSSAFPIAFPPLTLRNFPINRCQYTPPKWVKFALKDFSLNPRRYRQAQNLMSYLGEDRPFIHLVDGGIGDNIGLRAPLEAMSSSDSSWSIQERINSGAIERLVVIIVDAKTMPPTTLDQEADPPGVATVLEKAATVPMDNFSFDTIDLLRDGFQERKKAAQNVRACAKKLKDACNADLGIAPPPYPAQYRIHVNFEAIADPKQREYFLTLPTTLTLPKDQVDKIVGMGQTLLRESPEFQKLLKDLQEGL